MLAAWIWRRPGAELQQTVPLRPLTSASVPRAISRWKTGGDGWKGVSSQGRCVVQMPTCCEGRAMSRGGAGTGSPGAALEIKDRLPLVGQGWLG
jgi:hypothetical protein